MTIKNTEIFAGSVQLKIVEESGKISFPVLVQYPTNEPSKPTAFGPYIMDVSPDAEVLEGQYPLVIISHGNGGSHLLYRTISTHLAKNGYIVAMVEHYGNNRNNNELQNTTENLINRPRHISLTINEMLSENRFYKSIASDKIAVIGHSMGGYTALALAGGVPRTKEGLKVDVSSDDRIKAIVLLAPGTGWFMNSLDKVTIPILMLTAQYDPVTPAWNAEIVLKGVPDQSQVIFREVENAGHFSFLSPFPDAMKKPDFLPSTDPKGFDREQFHKELPVEILDFLNDKLKGDSR
ncbi:Predicted dienelactone hydrolase [Pseudarcicella hirudinis]|uniref:Predicted dienelactone hydrolase n=1 Tax=Pseudarcicella hirudinis TaxID=1079859 RepID=A0A1I5VJV5_9BACT|nr:alpha/beta fold hydrolase [Pseudarcicella hirudinis]SFQ07785.1 Predicted dienelactone hydrolase [Pseudarcicella hirudinis]